MMAVPCYRRNLLSNIPDRVDLTSVVNKFKIVWVGFLEALIMLMGVMMGNCRYFCGWLLSSRWLISLVD